MATTKRISYQHQEMEADSPRKPQEMVATHGSYKSELDQRQTPHLNEEPALEARDRLHTLMQELKRLYKEAKK